MDQSNDIKALMSMGTAQAILLAHLYKSHFAINPGARLTMPKALKDAAMFMGPMPKEAMDEEAWVDIQARTVLYLQAFLDDVEAQLQRKEDEDSKTF